MSKYKAALYMRISNSDAKAGESESLANQRKLLMDFVAKNPDIEVVAEHLDDGVTGLVYDRPAFNELMKDIIDGKVNCAITKDLSRLGREYIDTGKYLREVFPKYGVRFIAISDGIDTISETNLSEELGVTLKTLLNDAYSRDISKKTRSTLNSKRENGEFVGACPVYGYVRSEEKKNLLVPDVYASEVIKDIYKLRKDGMSAAKIAETLNKQGVLSPLAYKKDRGLPTPKGGFADKDGSMWSATTIIRILKDETYTGVLLQGKQTTFNYKLKDKKHKPKDEWVITYDAHEAIIQRQDFDLVQKLMNIDTRTAPNGDSVHLFAGALICGCCGNRMTRKIVPYKDKKYHYYYCPTGKKNGCTAKMMKETDIVTCVATSVKTYIENVVDLDVLLETLGTKKIAKQITDKFMVQINDVDKQIQAINTFKIKLYESLVSEVISKSEYSSYKKDYDKDLFRLKNAKELLISKYEQEKVTAEDKLKWTEHFKEFKDMQTLSRRAVVQLIHSITLHFGDDKHIHICYRYENEYENIIKLIQEKSQREAV